MSDSFLNMVNANPTLSDRFADICAQVVKAGKELYGVSLDHEDVAQLTEARASTLGAHALDDGYLTELAALPKVKARIPKPSATKTEQAKVEYLPDAREAANRFAEARRNGFKTSDTGASLDDMPAAQKVQYLMTLPPGDARKISLGRKWGLIK